MKEVQNKNLTDEAKRLNEELDQNLKDLQPESKEEFQGFEVKEEKNEKKKKAKKKKTPKQIIKRVIIVLAVIILLPCAAIAGMWALGKGSLFGGKMKMSKNVDGVKVQNQGDLVIYNGHKYQYNKDITSILFMGVDRDKINTDEEYLKKHGAGQSDTLFLAAVNTSTGKISLINVPRDIMANVKTYDENGKYSGRKLRQLCLAYAYGDGKAKSCKNAVDAVSKVLYGIPIDSYMSINLSAISVLKMQ